VRQLIVQTFFMRILFIAFAALSFHAAATEPTFHVTPTNGQDGKEFKGPGMIVHTPAQVAAASKSKTLNIKLRDSLIKDCDLTEADSWDELDRDFIVMRAIHNDLKGLIAKYPNIPEEKLKKLKSLVKKNQELLPPP
jgi:hypothetical protein